MNVDPKTVDEILVFVKEALAKIEELETENKRLLSERVELEKVANKVATSPSEPKIVKVSFKKEIVNDVVDNLIRFNAIKKEARQITIDKLSEDPNNALQLLDNIVKQSASNILSEGRQFNGSFHGSIHEDHDPYGWYSAARSI